MCPFDDCDTATQPYVTINHWVEHMRWSHAASYRCKVPGHEKLDFDSREAFEQHMIDEHHDDFRKSELPGIIKRAITPSEGTFVGLIDQKQALSDSDHLICPLCGLKPASGQRVSDADGQTNSEWHDQVLRDHMAGHLEALALLSLPIDEEMNSQASEPSRLGEIPRDANEDMHSLLPVRPLELWNVEPYRSYDARVSTEHIAISNLGEDGISPNEGYAPTLDGENLSIWDNIFDEIHRSKFASHNIAGDRTLRCVRQYTAVTMISRWWRKSKATQRVSPNKKTLDEKTIAAVITIQRAYRSSKEKSTELPRNKRASHLWQLTFEILRLERTIFLMIRNWLEHCIRNHPVCSAAITPFTPTRLIDVDPESPRLVDGISVSDNKYLALSFVWGISVTPRLTMSSIEHLKRGIAPSTLPQLFQDAIRLTKALRFRYLWIDALCIIQDHSEETQNEFRSIGRVYDGATMIVAAARAKSADKSLFAPRKLPLIHFNMHSQFGKERWRSRAWTFQDQILSVRFLSFEMAEVAWRCRMAEGCECTDLKSLPPEENKSIRRLFLEWRREFVAKYTQRELVHPSDRLTALGNVAASYATTIERVSGSVPTYLAGIWQGDLLASLCWFNRRGYAQLHHRIEYGAPSWSWAAINDPVDFSELTYFDAIKIVRCEVVGDLYGFVNSGRLIVEGYLLEVNIDLELSPSSRESIFTTVSLRGDMNRKWRLKLPDKAGALFADPSVSMAVYENYNNAKFDIKIDDANEADLRFMAFGFDWNGKNPPLEFHGLLLRKRAGQPYERLGYIQQRVPEYNPFNLKIMSSNFKLLDLGEAVRIQID